MEFTVNVNIKAPELVQAILTLAGATGAQIATPETPAGRVTEQQATPTQADKPKRQQRTTRQEEPEPPTHQDSEAPQLDVPTVVALRAKAQSVGTTPDAKKAIKAILDKFGSKSISDIPEEKRADFLAELDEV